MSTSLCSLLRALLCSALLSLSVAPQLMRNYNVGVTVVTPWFVASGDITDKLSKGKPHKLPLVVSEKKAMNITMDGIQRDVAVVSFPFIAHFLTYFIGGLPITLRSWAYTLLNTKYMARKMVGEPAGIEHSSSKKTK